MLRNKDILDEKNKLLRQTSKEVTFPMEQDDLVAIDKMIEYRRSNAAYFLEKMKKYAILQTTICRIKK